MCGGTTGPEGVGGAIWRDIELIGGCNPVTKLELPISPLPTIGNTPLVRGTADGIERPVNT